MIPCPYFSMGSPINLSRSRSKRDSLAQTGMTRLVLASPRVSLSAETFGTKIMSVNQSVHLSCSALMFSGFVQSEKSVQGTAWGMLRTILSITRLCRI